MKCWLHRSKWQSFGCPLQRAVPVHAACRWTREFAAKRGKRCPLNRVFFFSFLDPFVAVPALGFSFRFLFRVSPLIPFSHPYGRVSWNLLIHCHFGSSRRAPVETMVASFLKEYQLLGIRVCNLRVTGPARPGQFDLLEMDDTGKQMMAGIRFLVLGEKGFI